MFLKGLNNRVTHTIPAKVCPVFQRGRNPEGIQCGFRVKHGMANCTGGTVTLHKLQTSAGSKFKGFSVVLL